MSRMRYVAVASVYLVNFDLMVYRRMDWDYDADFHGQLKIIDGHIFYRMRNGDEFEEPEAWSKFEDDEQEDFDLAYREHVDKVVDDTFFAPEEPKRTVKKKAQRSR